MSRGLGNVEVRILEILGGVERLRPAQIAFEIAGRVEPTAALHASVRRALASLRKKGRVFRVMGDWMLMDTWQWCLTQREHDEEVRHRDKQEEGKACSADDRTRQDDGPDETLEGAVCGPIDYRTERRRLSKILALLGSPHEGEVLNAARQAEQIRRRLALSWEEIIMLPGAEIGVTTAEPGFGPNFSS